MGKKKKKNIADAVRSKKQQQEKKINPFEVKINRQKHHVLGRKVSKHDRGMPGLSRSKALKKRKATLLQEYEQRFKSNKFVDRRIGETDASLTVEDKMMKRYAKEQLRHHGKDKFNLNEEDDLTHYGQSLSEIEKFEEPSVSDEEDNELGLIDAQMVSEQHFGGFFTRKEMEEKDDRRSWKERMEEVITKSKKEKYERQMERDKNVEMTEKLDAEWKELRFLVSGKSKANEPDGCQAKADDYDIMVKELKFEMKGKPTDRLKTEEELAKEEKERLEKLEMDRMRRMKGEEEEVPSGKHKSADDLDDCLAYDDSRYKVGHPEEERGADEGDESNNSEEEEEQEEDEASDKDDDDDDNSGEDRDLESEEEEVLQATEQRIETSEKSKAETSTNLQDKQKIMEAAQKELPYTFKAPEDYDELVKLLHENCAEDQLIIVDRIRKCHHPSLAEDNKQKMETFLALLTQYFCDLTIQEPVPLQLINGLVRPLYDLAKQAPAAAGHVIRDQIADCHKDFSSRSGRVYPGLDTLLLLKLVSVLFPTSDFRHPVTTPSLIFIGEILAKCRVDDSRSIAAGLFVCSLCLEYVTLSKRYVPEAINFLHGLLFLAADKDSNKVEAVIPPFRAVGANIDLLRVTSLSDEVLALPLKVSKVLSASEEVLNTVQFRLSVIDSCLTLVKEFSVLYEDLTSYQEIFAPIKQIAVKLPTQYYPAVMKAKLEQILSDITTHSDVPRSSLAMEKKKPKLMKMFEPKIEEVFDGRKTKAKGTKEQNEKQKLTHKYKRELKGAKRDLKQDARFLARQQLQEQLDRDAERKRKVNEIHQMLSSQEGEFKAMKRAKPN